MRLALRIGSAALLIIVSLYFFYRRSNTLIVSNPKSLWHFDTTSFPAVFRANPPEHDSSHRKWGVATDNMMSVQYQTTPVVFSNEGIVVMGKLRDEDTAWVPTELANWRNFIYTVDDPTAPAHTPKNKGREALPYLQFIIDHYHDLPTPIVFMHAHHDSWHVDTTDNVNFNSVRSLQRPFVEKQGFVNLRCQPTPGCPAEMQPFRNPPKPSNPGEAYYAAAWKELFGNTKVPQTIAAPCCSQFAVSRTQVLQRPLSDYQRMYNWVLNNDLPDEATANIMEYSWHIIFGQDPVFCPDVFQCYADVFGEEVIPA